MKIGRNDPCPCGSGKKYKKCCIDKEKHIIDKLPLSMDEMTRRMIQKEKVDAIPFFEKFDKKDLVSIISLLQILPENHSKNIRLEEIQKQAIKCNGESNNLVDVKQLSKFIHEKFPHSHREDPPENLFTENIITPAGNFKIFNGIAEGQAYVLQQMLTTLNRPELEISEEFKTESLDSCLLLLMISEYLVKALEYNSNMLVQLPESEDIFFPDIGIIESSKHHLRLNERHIKRLAKGVNVNPNLINNFCVDLTSSKFEDDHPESNPLIFYPILKEDEEYLVASPTTLIPACINNVLTSALKYNGLDKFLLEYASLCWSHCCFLLNEMGYMEIDFELPQTDLPLMETICLFDTDKLAYVQLIYDAGKDYDTESPSLLKEDKLLYESLATRRKQIFEALSKDNKTKNYSYLNITLVSNIGRPYRIPFNTPGANWEYVAMSAHELEILYKSGKCHNLTFWNYSRAQDDLELATPFFLDNITFFIDNDESLYTGDDAIDYLMITVGSALDFKAEAIINKNEHLATFPSENSFQLFPVHRIKLPALLEIYSTSHTRIIPFMVTTSINDKEIWIRPSYNIYGDASAGKEQFDKEICIAIAFWIQEMSLDLAQYLNLRYIKQIVITIDTKEIDNPLDVFEGVDPNISPLDEILVEITSNKINISIQEKFYHCLYRTDNLGEQYLMKKILLSIASALQNAGIDCDLNNNIIDEIINTHIPIGKKKKLLFQISTFDIRISPFNIKGLRSFHSYEKNKQLDHLAEILSSAPYKPIKTLSSEKKKHLINSVVLHFYTQLRALLNKYNSEDVLIKLLFLYESAIQTREHFKLEVVPKIECFKKHCDIFTKVLKENRKNNEHSISLRCLIEHIIAEPSSGTATLDVSAVDSSIAFMSNIIAWGFISDELKFNITDFEISLLPSGRIGTEKSFQSETIEPFYSQKVQEQIQDYDETFDLRFTEHKPSKGGLKEDPTFNDAFYAEYQVSFEDYSNIMWECIEMAYKIDGSVYRDKKTSFISEITAKLQISAETVEKILLKFSLFNRGKVENVSSLGFKNEDFYPWRYNRELSLLKRPFIMTLKNNEEYIWFGARILLDSKFSMVSKLFSGTWTGESAEMASYQASINDKVGKDFNNKAFEYIMSKCPKSIIIKEQKIGPNAILYCETDLGDIDILVVDIQKKKILMIESKKTVSAKVPYEMHLELMKFISGKKPWIEKVKKRNDWISNNFEKISQLPELAKINDIDTYTYEYIFLTEEVIPLPFLKMHKIDFRFVSFYNIQENISVLFQ